MATKAGTLTSKIAALLPSSAPKPSSMASIAGTRPTAPAPVSKVGMTELGDRATSTAPEPSSSAGAGGNRTQIYTYFTKAPVVGEQPLALYNGDRLWAKIVLTLETAGPVAVGQDSQLQPVLSGRGQLLRTGVPTSFTIARGTKLYIASTAVNRVAVVVEPLPWLEQIVGYMGMLVGKAAATVSRKG